jgi:hypothetical protein
MLSLTQRGAVYQAVKTSYTVNSEAITCSKIYSNQKMTTYPTFVLYFSDEGNINQQALGDYIGTDGSNGQRSLTTLSVNLYAKQSTAGMDAHRLGADLMKQFIEDVHANWKSLSSDSVRLFRVSPVRNLTNMMISENVTDTSRYQVDLQLSYDITW